VLSIIVPTYNERANIEALLERVTRALRGVPHEMLVIDDSTDGTDAVVAACAGRYPGLTLVHRDGRRGLATAAVDGIGRATGDAICVLDADLQHPPELIPLLMEALDRADADVAVASRNVPGGGYEAFAPTRRLASRGATLLAQALLSRARLVSDPMSGFFVVRRRVVEGATLRPLGYKILLEILVRGRLSRVAEVPYRFQARGAGASKLTWRQQWEYLRHVARLLGVQPDDLRFIRFCLVGGSGAALNMGILWALAGRGVHYVQAGIAATICATTWNFLWNDLFTWRDRRSASLRVTAARYLQYWAVTGASSAVQVGLLALLTLAGLPYLVSNLVGIGVASIWNFWSNGRWTWKAPARPVMRAVYDGRRDASSEVAGPSAGGTM
jgi:dolichol-phosphate mannosyltransferase